MNELPSPTERALILGQIIDAWSGVEEGMLGVFSALLDRGDHVARAIFLSVRGFKEQREMTANLAQVSLGDVTAERVIGVLDKAEKASQKRNKIIHGQWIERGFLDKNTGKMRLHIVRLMALPIRADQSVTLNEHYARARGKLDLHQSRFANNVFDMKKLERAKEEFNEVARRLLDLRRELDRTLKV